MGAIKSKLNAALIRKKTQSLRKSNLPITPDDPNYEKWLQSYKEMEDHQKKESFDLAMKRFSPHRIEQDACSDDTMSSPGSPLRDK